MTKSNKLTHLIRALDQHSEDQMTCAECEGRLPDYVQAVTAGQATATAWLAISQHIASCPHCSQEYTLLAGMLRTLYEELPDDLSLAGLEPDLSFLQPAPIAAVAAEPLPSWWRDGLGHITIALATLFQGEWRPTWQPALAGLKAGAAAGLLAGLTVPDLGDGRTIQLEITQNAATSATSPMLCTVAVKVTAPDRDPLSQDGIAVTLKSEEEELARQWTDALGVAIFPDLPVTHLPHLALVIAPAAADQ